MIGGGAEVMQVMVGSGRCPRCARRGLAFLIVVVLIGRG
jgi:hypothetical protein